MEHDLNAIKDENFGMDRDKHLPPLEFGYDSDTQLKP